MYFYTAYGLRVRSPLALPGLAGCDGQVDIEITFGKLHLPSCGTIKDGCVRASIDDALLYWRAVGAFLVCSGREIVVDVRSELDDRLVHLLLLGPVFAALLHQRGQLVLHASAVSIDGDMVAFLGPSGCGKSTIAAALYARGHAMVADDVFAADMTGENPTAHPGFPQVRLWPAASQRLHVEQDRLRHPLTDKRACSATRGFSTEPLPVRCLYVLAKGSNAQIDNIKPQGALVELIRHTYTARLLDASRSVSHFHQCSQLVAKVPVRRLTSQRSPAALSGLATLVEKDVGV
jgi:hypothetical protein